MRSSSLQILKYNCNWWFIRDYLRTSAVCRIFLKVWFSVHFTGYFKNEKKERERKRGRISQQFTSIQLTPPGCRSLRKKISRALRHAEITDSKLWYDSEVLYASAHVKIHSIELKSEFHKLVSPPNYVEKCEGYIWIFLQLMNPQREFERRGRVQAFPSVGYRRK